MPATLVFNGGPSTFAGVIQDVLGEGTSTTALTVSGGTLTLTGANTYTGGTTINAGTMLNVNGSLAAGNSASVGGILAGSGTVNGLATLASGATIGSASNMLTVAALSVPSPGSASVANGAVLAIPAGGLATVNGTLGGGGSLALSGSLAGSGTVNAPITLNNGSMIGSANTLTVGGAIGDGGHGYSLGMAGPGTLVLTASNTYSGSTAVNGGTLQLGIGVAGQDGSIGSTSGATLSNSTAIVYKVAGSQTAGYGINGTGSLNKAGSGTLVLTASNTYNGSTAVNGGTLQLGTGVAGQDGSIGSTSGVTLSNSTAIVYKVAGSQTAGYGINGTGSLTKTGSGTLVLAASNGYSGPTVVNAGQLTISSTGSINIASAVSVNAGAALALGQSGSSNTLTLNGGRLSLGADWGTGGTITFSGGDVIHTFTSTTGTSSLVVPYAVSGGSVLVVAGGGGGGINGGGGGGAGGLLSVNAITIAAGSTPITVGAGGTGATSTSYPGQNGANSTF